MKHKYQKSYSLTTAAMHIIANMAKEAKRNPSDFLDQYFLDNHKTYLPAQINE